MTQQTVVLNPKPMDVQEHSYTFTQEGKPIIVIDSKGFNYKGELIDDSGEMYNLFKRYFEQSLTPIELPSDEEIANKADDYVENDHILFVTNLRNSKRYGFADGAKWMRDKIQGGNK